TPPIAGPLSLGSFAPFGSHAGRGSPGPGHRWPAELGFVRAVRFTGWARVSWPRPRPDRRSPGASPPSLVTFRAFWLRAAPEPGFVRAVWLRATSEPGFVPRISRSSVTEAGFVPRISHWSCSALHPNQGPF